MIRLQNVASGDVFRIAFIIPPFSGDGLIPVIKREAGGELVQVISALQGIGLFGQLLQVGEVHVFRGNPLIQLIYAFKTVVDIQINPDAGHAAGPRKFPHFIGDAVSQKGEVAGGDQGIVRCLAGHAGEKGGILQCNVIGLFFLFPAGISPSLYFFQPPGIDGFSVAVQNYRLAGV